MYVPFNSNIFTAIHFNIWVTAKLANILQDIADFQFTDRQDSFQIKGAAMDILTKTTAVIRQEVVLSSQIW